MSIRIENLHAVEPICQGSYGLVYRAEEEGHGHSGALVEFLDAEGLDTAALVRALQERLERVDPVRHPFIARPLGIFEVDGHPALVHDDLRGCSLGSVLSRGAVPVSVACELIRKLARALHAAWDRVPGGSDDAYGLVHGDLTPDHVWVGRNGQVKLRGLGVSPSEGSREADPARSTLPFPTPWTSPEAQQGVDSHAADVYAVGAILAQLVTGVAPSYASTQQEWHEAVAASTADRVREETGTSALGELVAWCLDFDPEKRPVASEVEAWMDRVRRQHREPRLSAWCADRIPYIARQVAEETRLMLEDARMPRSFFDEPKEDDLGFGTGAPTVAPATIPTAMPSGPAAGGGSAQADSTQDSFAAAFQSPDEAAPPPIEERSWDDAEIQAKLASGYEDAPTVDQYEGQYEGTATVDPWESAETDPTVDATTTVPEPSPAPEKVATSGEPGRLTAEDLARAVDEDEDLQGWPAAAFDPGPPPEEITGFSLAPGELGTGEEPDRPDQWTLDELVWSSPAVPPVGQGAPVEDDKGWRMLTEITSGPVVPVGEVPDVVDAVAYVAPNSTDFPERHPESARWEEAETRPLGSEDDQGDEDQGDEDDDVAGFDRPERGRGGLDYDSMPTISDPTEPALQPYQPPASEGTPQVAVRAMGTGPSWMDDPEEPETEPSGRQPESAPFGSETDPATAAEPTRDRASFLEVRTDEVKPAPATDRPVAPELQPEGGPVAARDHRGGARGPKSGSSQPEEKDQSVLMKVLWTLMAAAVVAVAVRVGIGGLGGPTDLQSEERKPAPTAALPDPAPPSKVKVVTSELPETPGPAAAPATITTPTEPPAAVAATPPPPPASPAPATRPQVTSTPASSTPPTSAPTATTSPEASTAPPASTTPPVATTPPAPPATAAASEQPPAPAASPAPATPAPTSGAGTFAVRGDADRVRLVGGDGRSFGPGPVPEGTYDVMVSFTSGATPVRVDGVRMRGNATLTVDCRAAFMRCRVQ